MVLNWIQGKRAQTVDLTEAFFSIMNRSECPLVPWLNGKSIV